LLPGRWRVLLGVLAPFSALGLLALAWWYAGRESAGALDTVLDDQLVAHRGPHLHLLWTVTDLGSPPVLPLGILVLAVAAGLTQRRWPPVLLAVAGPMTAVLLTEFVLKPLVGRTHEGGLSLPSGHTTSITAMAWVFVLLFVAGARHRPWWLRALLTGLAVVAVLAVAGSMVALDQHYATDTMAGALEATAVVGAVALLLDGWLRRYRPAGRSSLAA
jgi:membrane-associated phospholipid phosphatase